MENINVFIIKNKDLINVISNLWPVFLTLFTLIVLFFKKIIIFLKWVKRKINSFKLHNSSTYSKTIEDVKKLAKILFIDDEEFNTVGILKRNGWKHVKWIPDVDNLENKDVKSAHLLFIDIHGVAKAMFSKDEGLGLIRELKKIYPYKKYVTYTAESQGDRLQKELFIADKVLRKNADAIEFTETAEDLCLSFFDKNNLIKNVHLLLNRNDRKDEKRIVNFIRRVEKNKEISETDVCKYLKISTGVESITNLFELFYLNEISFKK